MLFRSTIKKGKELAKPKFNFSYASSIEMMPNIPLKVLSAEDYAHKMLDYGTWGNQPQIDFWQRMIAGLNPAPFCLLDEVDAPLDDANTSRFCNLVKEMSAQTQFLYISHNRLTMEMAEQLVGVTMQEKGVSRVVAVDIKQASTQIGRASCRERV